MTRLLPEAVGLVGFGCLCGGVYLAAGEAAALMLGGGVLMVAGLLGARRAGR